MSEACTVYDEDQFGYEMGDDFITIAQGATVKDAMRTLIAKAPEKHNIQTLFVTDATGQFCGAVTLPDLIAARAEQGVQEIVRTPFPCVLDTERISDGLDRLREGCFGGLAVLSEQGQALLGVVTAERAVELVDRALAEDYAMLAALGGEGEVDEPLLASMKKRVPWLAVLLLLGLSVSLAVGAFERVVNVLPVLVAFQSLILGMAGNVGTQSLAVTVRALGGGEVEGALAQTLFVLREGRVALLCGAVLGVLSVVMVGGFLLAFGAYAWGFVLCVALCVGVAMCFAMSVSGLTGAAIPMLLYRLGVDPAVASGPLITTINDLVAIVTYYGLAWILLLNVLHL